MGNRVEALYDKEKKCYQNELPAVHAIVTKSNRYPTKIAPLTPAADCCQVCLFCKELARCLWESEMN